MYNCYLYNQDNANFIRFWIPLTQFVKPRIKWTKLIQVNLYSTERHPSLSQMGTKDNKESQVDAFACHCQSHQGSYDP